MTRTSHPHGTDVERAVPEWQATIDALQALPEIGADAPIGYSGMTLASATGISLTVSDRRIRAAIFGGVFVYDAVLAAARRVTIPIEFLLPWDDDEIDRESGPALFDAFASGTRPCTRSRARTSAYRRSGSTRGSSNGSSAGPSPEGRKVPGPF